MCKQHPTWPVPYSVLLGKDVLIEEGPGIRQAFDSASPPFAPEVLLHYRSSTSPVERKTNMPLLQGGTSGCPNAMRRAPRVRDAGYSMTTAFTGRPPSVRNCQLGLRSTCLHAQRSASPEGLTSEQCSFPRRNIFTVTALALAAPWVGILQGECGHILAYFSDPIAW
jgi:hypothetical protein